MNNMSMPMISPDNVDHRRGGHIIGDGNDVQRIQKQYGKNMNDDKVVEKERPKTNNDNISTMMKERQLAMVVSPENCSNYNTTTAGVIRGVGFMPPAMISPPSATPTTTKQQQSALISDESSTTSIKQHNIYETPRKINSPPTGVTPFLLTSTSQKHNNNNNNSIQKTLSNNYSPLSPNTKHYISNNSPFKSSSQILDDKLHSLMKMENSLEDKINNYNNHEDEDDYGERQCCVDYSEEGGVILYTSPTNNVAVNNGVCNNNDTSPENNNTNDSVGIQLAFHTPNEEVDSQAIGQQTTAGTMYHTAKERLASSSVMNEEDGSSSSSGSAEKRYTNLHHLRGNSKEGLPGAVVAQTTNDDTSFDSTTTASSSSNIKLRRVLWRADTVGRGEEDNIVIDDDDDQSEKENSHTMLFNETFKRIEGSKLKGKQQPPSPTILNSTTNENRSANEGNDQVVQSTNVQDASLLLQDNQLDTPLERSQLLDMVSEMKNQLNELLHDRESLIAQRDPSAKQSKRYKSESKTLTNEVKTLESGMQDALQLVQDVQKVTLTKEEEVNELSKLLLNRDAKVEELQSLLTLKEEEVKELSSTAKIKEEEWNKKLDDTEQQHKEDLDRLTIQLTKTHSEEMERVKSKSQVDQMSTLQHTDIETHSAPVSQRVAKAPSWYTVDSLQQQEEPERVISKDCTVPDVEGSVSKNENIDISSTSFYIDHEEGFRFFSSIDKSDISETSSERDGDVVNESAEILPAAAESVVACENVQANVSMISSKTDKQREEEIDRITREHSDEIERLKSELATAKSTTGKLMSEHEKLQSDYASAVKENTDKVNALQMKIKEMNAGFENERSALILEKEQQQKEGPTLVSAELREVESQVTKSMFMKEQEHSLVVTELWELEAKNARLVKDYEERIRQLEANLESSTLELGTTLKQRDGLLSSQQDLECKIYDMESAYNSLTEQFSTLQVEYQDVAKTIVDKDQVLVSKEDEIVSLTEKLVLSETELSDIHKKLTHINKERTEAKEQLLQAYHREEELNTLTKKLMSEKTSLKSQNVVKSDEKLSIEKQLATVTKERDMLSSEVERLEDQLKQMIEQQRIAENAQIQLREALKDNAEFHAQKEALGETVAELERSASAKVDEIKQLQAKIKTSTEMVTDLQQQNENLMNKNKCILSDLKSKETLIQRVQSDNEALKEIETSLQAEKEAASKLKSKFEQTEDILLNLQASKLFVENRLEEVLQDKSHLSTEVESMHDTIATLEVSKESLTASLQDYQEKADQLSTQVTALENQAKSNDALILNLEVQLSLKVNEVCSLHKTVNSHEETLVELSDQLQSLGMQKAQVEEILSSLHSKMDHVMCERDGLAHQLDKAVKELESLREERNSLSAKVTNNPRVHHHHDEVHCHIFETAAATMDVSTIDSDLKIRSNEQSYFDVLPGKGIREILNSSCISEREVDLVCEKMSNVRLIMTQIDQERKQLKKEVKHLRADLELAQGELTTANKEQKKIHRQTLALRGVVSQARTLLEKAEEEKKQLALDLENAQKAMNHLIQQNSSQPYNAIVAQSEDEINKLKQELQREKNESMRLLVATRKKAIAATIDDAEYPEYHHKPNKKISQYDVSYEASHNLNASLPPKVTSKERFKVEKGHSMFGMLKDIKKSGRRGVKYRKAEE